MNGSFNLSWEYDHISNNMRQAPAFLTISLSPYANNNSPLDHYNDYSAFQAPFDTENAGVIPSSSSHIVLTKMDPDKGSMN